MTKRSISILLVISMLIACFPTWAIADDTTMTFKAGKSYEIVNSSKDTIILYSESGTGANYDYVDYKVSGEVSFWGNTWDSIVMTDRSKIRITVGDKLDLNIRIPVDSISAISITETSVPALHRFTLDAGKSYEMVNTSKSNISIINNSSNGSTYPQFDYVNNSVSGQVSFGKNEYGIMYMQDRDKRIITVGQIYDIECYVPYESKDIIKITEVSVPALYNFTLEAGKNYELVNTSTNRIDIINNSSSGSSYPQFDYVSYSVSGEVSFSKNDYGVIYMDDRLIRRITIGDIYDIECYMPYESKDLITITETPVPALYNFTLEAGKSYELVNTSAKRIDIVNNSSSGDSYPKFDYTYYSANGEASSTEDNYGLIYMYENSKMRITIGDIYDLDCWIPYDNGSLLTGIPVPAGGFLTNKATPMQNTQMPTSTTPYIYDIVDPGASVVLPTDKLDTVTDEFSAAALISSAAEMMTKEQKASATGVDIVTLFAEEASAQAASKTVAGSGILINKAAVQELQSVAASTRTAAETALSSAGITIARELDAGVKFKTTETKSLAITVDSSAANTTADNVRVETSNYRISLSSEAIKANTGDSPLVITVTENSPDAAIGYYPIVTASASNRLYGRGLNFTAMDANNSKTYKITFNKPVTENIKVSLPPAAGDTAYQAVIKSDGTAVGGKYNPATGMLDVKIKNSDTYTVKVNEKDFSDIQNKSKEMQQAIKVMASKGIINGTTATTFGPDGTITRAEIAALIVRTLSKLDPNANGGFSDVKSKDWYFGAVGSAKKFGIINGTSATTFAPMSNIQKDQIVAVSARTLRTEMKYKNPSDVEKWLGGYTDRSDIPGWGNTDIALATRENLVVKRTDGKFLPAGTMTRGDAAIILYRMFMKIW